MRRCPTALLVAVLAVGIPGAAAELAVELAIGDLDHAGGIALTDLRLSLADGDAVLQVAELRVGALRWRDLALRCRELAARGDFLVCAKGRLRAPPPWGGAGVHLAIAPASATGELSLSLVSGAAVSARLGAGGELAVQVRGLDLAALAPLMPQVAAQNPTGLLDCELSLPPEADERELAARCALRDGSFASEDGLQAGEAIDLAVEIGAEADAGAGGWRWQLSGEWRGGAVYLDPLYVPAGFRWHVAGVWTKDRLHIVEAELDGDGIGRIHGAAELQLQPLAVERLAVRGTDLELATLGQRVLAPLLLPASADALLFRGRASLDLELAPGGSPTVAVWLDEAGIEHQLLDMGIGPATGSLAWSGDGTGTLALAVGGAHWRGLQFGDFPLRAALAADRVTLSSLSAPLFDGAVRLNGLDLWRGEAGWQGETRGAIDPIALPVLTAAARMPVLGGTLSARFPRVRVSPGEIAVDGAIDLQVFDGQVRISGLRLIEPFGVGAYARAEIAAERLDLGLLTESFDFGSITGRIDARVSGLELAGWRPVRFAAQIESSPGRYRRRISQRAVQNLGALGGPGVVNAIQRSALQFFDSFGYRRLGWSCVLESGVCEMAGVSPGTRRDDGGFVIVEGRGIPALDVVGYNRRVDWTVLLGRLSRVIGAGTAAQ